MTPEKFNRLIQHPALLDAGSVQELQELVKEFPYFEAARMLLAKSCHTAGSEAYPLSLRLAAAYATDRSRLKSLIEGSVRPEFIAEKADAGAASTTVAAGEASAAEMPAKTAETATEIPDQPATEFATVAFTDAPQPPAAAEPTTPQPEAGPPETAAENPLLDLIRSRLSEMEIELSSPEAEAQETADIPRAEQIEQPASHDELIDKFIREEPRISAVRKEFFDPHDMARLSTSLPEDIVSETLARIYEQQGYTDTALKIYQKLMLLFPEKRSYFAARIEELKKKRK